MKIAHVISHQSPYDSQKLVGVKKMVSVLAKAQIEKGHDVVIIATKNSNPGDFKIFETILPLRDLGISVYDSRSFIYGIVHGGVAADYIRSNQFDIVHNHAEQNFIPYIQGLKTPVISTIHGTDFSEDIKFLYKSFQNKFRAIALSKYAAVANDFIKYNGVVYNAIDARNIEYGDGGEEMFWLGRINPKKGVVEAATVAAKTQKKISIVGYIEAGQEDYHKKLVEMLDAEYVNLTEGFAEKNVTQALIGRSKLFLNPILWEEPFGLVMIESMASGTPVVSFARGSVQEILEDGKTGFIVNPSDTDKRGDFIIKKTGIEGLCEAVDRVYSLGSSEYQAMRQASKKHVEENFTIEKMSEGYEKAYKEAIGI